jgi:hypothetical protein
MRPLKIPPEHDPAKLGEQNTLDEDHLHIIVEKPDSVPAIEKLLQCKWQLPRYTDPSNLLSYLAFILTHRLPLDFSSPDTAGDYSTGWRWHIQS